MNAREYHEYQPHLIGIIRESLAKLSEQYDIVVIEGAGSPAEINLRPFDIVNMAVARMASAPVMIVGDISLGGVFAWLVGTLELLEEEERSLVKGFVINKFRGDISLLRDGIAFLEAKTGKKVLGVLPFVSDLGVPEEDGIPESKWKQSRPSDNKRLLIQIVLLPHISNSTDFEPLEREPDVDLGYLSRPPRLEERFPDLLILPGSKSTMADLTFVRSSGLADYIYRCHEAGVPILGICGGYQMLGQKLLDPMAVESQTSSMKGLGLLHVETTFEPEKTTAQVRAMSLVHAEEIVAYEIHMGRTTSVSPCPVFQVVERSGEPVCEFDGSVSENGSVWGTYLHGIFEPPAFSRKMLNEMRGRRGWPPLPLASYHAVQDRLVSLATLVREHLDLPALQRMLSIGTSWQEQR
jgi:adenosylcobyric acid synthase